MNSPDIEMTTAASGDEEKELLTYVILSCDKYSDLWNPHVALLNKNWGDRTCRAVLVSDKPTDRQLERVDIIVAPSDSYPRRIEKACQLIKTKYILLVNDDYLLTKSIDDRLVREKLHQADANKIDFLSFFHNPRYCGRKFDGIEDFHYLRLELNHYQVNLYPALWTTSALLKTTVGDNTPWFYEVSLTKNMAEQGALCVSCSTKTFPIMDTVRKGHFLHKPYRYLMKNRLYSGTREVISYREEWAIGSRRFFIRIMPRWLFKLIKKIAVKRGKQYFSGNE